MGYKPFKKILKKMRQVISRTKIIEAIFLLVINLMLFNNYIASIVPFV